MEMELVYQKERPGLDPEGPHYTEFRVKPQTPPKPSNDLRERSPFCFPGPLITTFPSELVYINK